MERTERGNVDGGQAVREEGERPKDVRGLDCGRPCRSWGGAWLAFELQWVLFEREQSDLICVSLPNLFNSAVQRINIW